MGRTLGLDVHKRFAEVAVCEDGEVRRLGRVETSELPSFAESLGPGDHVVLESTSLTWAELLSKHAGRVTVSNPMRTKAIASAKVKTDKVDAKVLAQLGAPQFVPEVWAPDAQTLARAGGSPTARAWSSSARGCATRSMRCWRATWSSSR